MCGLTGYIHKKSKSINTESIINMLRVQKHRGPNDSGIVGINSYNRNIEELPYSEYIDFSEPKDVVFGFNRLSILDLSKQGHQPMKSKDGSVVLMMNGEVYNAFDFKDELENSGVTFRSQTDTEVVLELYIKLGIKKMLTRLNGMFAIAIYDSRIDKMFLARDRFGIKPLYILQNDEYFSFSSEMKSFKELPNFKFELDKEGVHEFLMFRNLINNTLFKGVKNLEPGNFLEFDLDSKETIEECFYDFVKESDPIIERLDFREVFKKAVKRQMLADVKVGTQLSGGVDSSVVTAEASKYSGDNALETISIIFDNKQFSEEQYIDKVKEILSLKAHKYTLNPSYYFEQIKNATWHFEQPLNHPNTIGIYLLSEKAKKHVTVLLSGEGADELLGGYDRILLNNKFNLLSFFRQIKKNGVRDILYTWNKRNSYILSSSYCSIKDLHHIYSGFDSQKALKPRIKIWESIHTKSDDFEKKRKYEIKTYLPDLLMRQDKMSMAHSIENRVPFLDNDLVLNGLKTNIDLLMNNYHGKKHGKFTLKKIAADLFGDDFAFRKKQGFGIPLREFMSSSNFEKMWKDEIIPGIKKRRLFNYEWLNNRYKNIKSVNSYTLDILWLMTSFELWAQQYLD